MPMKSADEIKKGLECCARVGCCHTCPYDEECHSSHDDACPMHMDALALIQQLEAERDALREDLKVELGCNVCKHFDNDAEYVSNDCMDCNKWCNWEWRGVQKED